MGNRASPWDGEGYVNKLVVGRSGQLTYQGTRHPLTHSKRLIRQWLCLAVDMRQQDQSTQA